MRAWTNRAKAARLYLEEQVIACVAGLCLSLTAIGCGEEPVVEEPVVRPVKIMTVGKADSTVSYEYPGIVAAAQHAEMAFEVPGRIVEFPVEEGQSVSAGDELARLDPRDYEAQLAKARAVLNKAQADLRRGQSLRAEDAGAIAQTTLDTYRRAVDVAQADYSQAEKAFEDAILRAPFSGTVARKLVKEFENVQAKLPVLVLQDTSSFEMEINVPERDLARASPSPSKEEIAERVKLEVVVSSIPDLSFPARFKEIATTADPTTRTFAVTLAFDRAQDVTILPGMTAKVITSSRQEATAAIRIPGKSARTDQSGAAFVWLVDPSSMAVRRTPVELGDLSGSDVKVLSGLKPGDQIAISGVYQLREGMHVRRLGE